MSVFSYIPEKTKTFELIAQIKNENEMLLGDLEAYRIYQVVKKTEKIPGDIAEVGVYKGASAKLMAETTRKTIHLFDTFEGLPDLVEQDNLGQFRKGDCLALFDETKNYLEGYSNIHFYKGIFPATSGPIQDKKFSFVHLDVDLYKPTLDSLIFFYPRLSPGGVIISHDYRDTPEFHNSGVKKAFDEFFSDKPEIVIEFLEGTQCLVVKVAQ
ncbi:MAG: TylF/MycF/NovP-related O-methyltransferase [Minisyncoccia bacterium]